MKQESAQVDSAAVAESAALYAATTTHSPSIEDVLALVSQLAIPEQLQVIRFLADQLSIQTRGLSASSFALKRRSLYGLLAEYGPGPTAEEIDESRREMMANFPRDDFTC